MEITFEYPEGATPIDDISGLKISWVKTQSHLNRVEAESIASAIEKHLLKTVPSPLSWFNIIYLKKVHKDMFDGVWDWAGLFRCSQTIPGIKPHQIQPALQNLCDDVFYWNTHECEMTFLEQAARIHHRLVFIHPFSNGNGRFSRIIADRYLKSWKCSFPIWPIELEHENKTRKQYILSLKSADSGNYIPLIDFMRKYGGRDPTLSELLGYNFYRKSMQQKKLTKLVNTYLKLHCNVNEKINGRHPLQLALELGFEEIAKKLIQSGANILNKDKSGFTPFEMAISKNYLSLAKIIYDLGYPYIPRQPPTSKLLNYHSQLYEFDRRYF